MLTELKRIAAILTASIVIGVVHGFVSPVELSLDPVATAGVSDSEFTDRGAPFLTLSATRRRFEDQSAAFVDARRSDEFTQGHVPGAVNVAPGEFSGGGYPDVIDSLAREIDVVVYCGNHDCDAAILVARRLREVGFSSVFVFEHGLEAWVAAGYETWE